MISFETAEFNKLTREIEDLKVTIESHMDEVVMPHYFQKMQSITYYAYQIGKQQIREAVTMTGRRRAAKGLGEPGRVETGKFIDGFTLDPGQRVGKTYEFNIGWLDGAPEWASYQELGFIHRGGMIVTGADALGAATRYIENEMDKLT